MKVYPERQSTHRKSVPTTQLCFAHRDRQGSIRHHQSVRTKSLTTAFPALWKKGSGSKCPYKPQWRDWCGQFWLEEQTRILRLCIMSVGLSHARCPFLKGWVGLTGSHLWYLGSLVAAWAQLPHSTWDLHSLIRVRTRVTCLGRWILYHWTTREAPRCLL